MNKTPALLQRAKERADKPAGSAGGFKRPDVKAMIPAEQRDVVDRVVAAGMRYLYSPAMREEVMAAIESQEPMPQKLGNNVTGLLLTLDAQTKGGIPQAALLPAGIELLGEAAEVLVASGQTVTQEDFNKAGPVGFSTPAQKMGARQEQIMAAAEQQVSKRGVAAEQSGEEPMDDTMPENAA